MEGANSSDSGSAGLIDVTNMSSNFSGASLHSDTSSEEKKKELLCKRKCPVSVEKAWFSNTPTSMNGMGLLQDEEYDFEIPDEYLDVSLESEHHLGEEAGLCSSDEDSSVDGETAVKHKESDDLADSDTIMAAQPRQMCGWVPPQYCLIPLPESPDGSDNEGEEGEVREGGDGCGISESEQQRQCEKELEVLFGYKPHPTVLPLSCEVESKVCSAGESDGDSKEKALVAARGNKRSNSTDSGVASISPHSTEGDVEQRRSQNGMEAAMAAVGAGRVNEVETKQSCSAESTKHQNAENGGEMESPIETEAGEGRVKSNMTPEKSPEQQQQQQQRLPVSQLRTPSEKLRKCSVFTGSPVVCSELEELKEAANMVSIPFPHLASSSSHKTVAGDHHTFTLTPPPTLQTTFTQDNATVVVTVPECEQAPERGVEKLSDTSSSSASSGCGSVGSRESAGKVPIKANLSKPIARNAFAYKASSGAPQVKVTKRPPLKMKSLLPVSGSLPSVLPSKIQRPATAAATRGKDSQLPRPKKASAGAAVSSYAGKPSGLMRPGQRIVRKSSDPGPSVLKTDKTFVKPTSSIAAKEISHPPQNGRVTNRANTPKQKKPTIASRQHPQHASSPSRASGDAKFPNNARTKKPAVFSPTPQDSHNTRAEQRGATASNTGLLSTSIVSNCSPSIQQSTPRRQNNSHPNITARAGGTVVKATSRPAEEKATTPCRKASGTITCTPKSSVMSTPNRVCPKFSFSSIELEPSSQPLLGDTFTKGVEGGPHPSVESTPKSARKKRRSLIPTPAKQENRGYKDVIPLTFSADPKSVSPLTTQQQHSKLDVSTGCSPSMPVQQRKASMPPPKARRPLVPRNKMASGLGRRQAHRAQPIKPVNTYKYSCRSFSEDSEPPIPAAKMVHSPLNNENTEASPHSAWSPIRRKPLATEDACFQCTKRSFR